MTALVDTFADIERVRQLGLKIADLGCDLIETGEAGASYGVIVAALKSQLKFWQAEARATMQ